VQAAAKRQRRHEETQQQLQQTSRKLRTTEAALQRTQDALQRKEQQQRSNQASNAARAKAAHGRNKGKVTLEEAVGHALQLNKEGRKQRLFTPEAQQRLASFMVGSSLNFRQAIKALRGAWMYFTMQKCPRWVSGTGNRVLSGPGLMLCGWPRSCMPCIMPLDLC
jgi:hypothetical protein